MRSQSDCVCLFVRVTLVVFRRVFGLYENHAHRISMYMSLSVNKSVKSRHTHDSVSQCQASDFRRFDVPRAPRTADAYPSSIDNVL